MGEDEKDCDYNNRNITLVICDTCISEIQPTHDNETLKCVSYNTLVSLSNDLKENNGYIIIPQISYWQILFLFNNYGYCNSIFL